MTTAVQFIGSGDAFGSGGRLQTCILVRSAEHCLALDFGATSLAGLRQHKIDPNAIQSIFLTHLHGDHCGGVPFLLLDAMLASKRGSPLTIAGPVGVEGHLARLQSVLFPGSVMMTPRFPLTYVEIALERPTEVPPVMVSAIAARHTRQTNPMALKIEIDGKSIVYTGDGEYTDDLAEFVAGADLLIAECYAYEKRIKSHMGYEDIGRLNAEKTVLTHMNDEMLAHQDDVPELCAYDGLVIDV